MIELYAYRFDDGWRLPMISKLIVDAGILIHTFKYGFHPPTEVGIDLNKDVGALQSGERLGSLA
jgi:hypothetical protein